MADSRMGEFERHMERRILVPLDTGRDHPGTGMLYCITSVCYVLQIEISEALSPDGRQPEK